MLRALFCLLTDIHWINSMEITTLPSNSNCTQTRFNTWYMANTNYICTSSSANAHQNCNQEQFLQIHDIKKHLIEKKNTKHAKQKQITLYYSLSTLCMIYNLNRDRSASKPSTQDYWNVRIEHAFISIEIDKLSFVNFRIASEEKWQKFIHKIIFFSSLNDFLTFSSSSCEEAIQITEIKNV